MTDLVCRLNCIFIISLGTRFLETNFSSCFRIYVWMMLIYNRLDLKKYEFDGWILYINQQMKWWMI